jgi:phosphomevalonate kinase
VQQVNAVSFEAKAPAKLVLMGEYAVLDGAPAIVAAVNREVRVTFTRRAEPGWRITTDLGGGQTESLEASKIGIVAGHDWLAPVASVLAGKAQALGIRVHDLPGGNLKIESAELYLDGGETKLGLGSSAAVIAALSAAVQAALVHADLVAPGPTHLEREWDAHRRAQGGHGSGVDIAASLYGGILRYQLVEGRPRVETLALPRAVEFSVVWTGVPASTSKLVAGVEAWKLNEPAAYKKHQGALSELAIQAVAACRAEDGGAFLGLVDAYREAMDAMGRRAGLPIMSDAHRDLADVAAASGVAYKPSGAGGGDVGLLFAPSKSALLQAGRSAEDAGYRLLDLGVHPTGVTVRRIER